MQPQTGRDQARSINNLSKLDKIGYMEIVFVGKRRKGNAQPPPPLPGAYNLTSVMSVKVLGFT